MRGMTAIVVVLLAAACRTLGDGNGDPYPVHGNPWERSAAPAAAAAGTAVPAADATVLEQLDTTRARVTTLEQEKQKLTVEVTSLTAVGEQLKRDNEGLALIVDANAEGRKGTEAEIAALRAQSKELEMRCRQLADDLLTERIQRVRVERELILVKVADAESQSGGQ